MQREACTPLCHRQVADASFWWASKPCKGQAAAGVHPGWTKSSKRQRSSHQLFILVLSICILAQLHWKLSNLIDVTGQKGRIHTAAMQESLLHTKGALRPADILPFRERLNRLFQISSWFFFFFSSSLEFDHFSARRTDRASDSVRRFHLVALHSFCNASIRSRICRQVSLLKRFSLGVRDLRTNRWSRVHSSSLGNLFV